MVDADAAVAGAGIRASGRRMDPCQEQDSAIDNRFTATVAVVSWDVS